MRILISAGNRETAMGAIVLMMMMALIAGSAQAQGRWKTTISGCQVWNDRPRQQVTVTWNGRCKNGKVESDDGTLLWSFIEGGKLAEIRYDGDMDDGDMDGRGELVLPNGDRYKGKFDGGLKHGKGAYIWASGNRYDGEFLKGAIQGKGVYAWSNGERYEGKFSKGLMHGKGEYIWVNGDRYEGEFRAGKAMKSAGKE